MCRFTLCICWDTPSENTGFRQLPNTSSAFKLTCSVDISGKLSVSSSNVAAADRLVSSRTWASEILSSVIDDRHFTWLVVKHLAQGHKCLEQDSNPHSDDLRPSHTAAITKTITIMAQRERIVLVELLHAEYAHSHSTNGMRSLCVIIVIVLVIAAVGLGL